MSDDSKSRAELIEELQALRAQVAALPGSEGPSREAEAAPKTGEEKFRLAFDHAAGGRVIAAPNGRFLRVNPAFCRITGFREIEMLSMAWRDIVYPADLQEYSQTEARLLAREIPAMKLEMRVMQKAGTILWVHLNAVLVRDDDDQPLFMIADLKDVTERRSAQQALRESEQKFRSLADESPNMIFINSGGKVVYANKRCEEIMGYTRSEFCADDFSFLSLIHPESHEAVKSAYARHQEGIEAPPSEYSLLTKSGLVLHTIINSKLIRYDGRPAILGIVTDITERKQTERAMAENETLLRATVESTADGILVVNESGKVTHHNARFAQLWRIPKDMAQRGDDDELLAYVLGQLNDPEAFLTKVRALYGTSKESLDTLCFKDGRVFERFSRPLIRDGKVAGRVWSFRDVTEHKRAREALELLERDKRLILDSTSDLVLYQDLNHQIVWANRACGQSVNANPEDLIGKSCYEVWHQRQDPCHSCPVAKVFESGTPQEGEIVSPDGRTWLIRGSPVFDDNGQLCGSVEVTTDITDRKRMEEELARAKRLETAGQLAGQIAHDFNNLLGPLVAYPDLIRGKIKPDGRLDELLTDMEAAAQQIADINQQLLTLGRRGHYKTEPIDLSKLAERTIRSMEISESIVVETAWAENLLPIRGGRAQLARIIANLIVNAVEAMGRCGTLSLRTENVYLDRPLVRNSAFKIGEYVRLDISDTGTGIPDDVRDKIFDPFFTTKTADRRRGSGLGLAVAHSVIQDHEGFLDVQTRLGEGTTFSMFFPADRTDIPAAGEAETLPRGHGERVMVVDDDPMQLRLAERTLTQLGYTVRTARSGEAAVKLVSENPQDVLMIDMVMEGIDGVETLRRVKAICPEQRALIFSGYAPTNKIQEARDLGASEFLPKPVQMSSLAQALHRTLHKVAEPCAPA